MYEILIIAFLIIAVLIVGLVLIQKGKGADMGASFGAGASGTLFGSAGSGNFLTRTTTILGILFFIISLALANLSGKKESNTNFSNIEETIPVETTLQSEDGIKQNDESINTINSESAVSPTSDIPE